LCISSGVAIVEKAAVGENLGFGFGAHDYGV
jgi:hypothetical protein